MGGRERQIPAAGRGRRAAEVVRPEFSYPLQQSLRLLDKLWLPLPFLRHTPAGLFCRAGQLARLQVVQLDEPDQDGNLLRVVLAFDTRAAAPGQRQRRAKAISAPAELRAGAPQPRAGRVSRSDSGRRLAARSVQPARRRAGAARRSGDQRRAENLRVSGALPQSAAHARPSAGGTADKMVAATLQQPAIDVDLVLDVGNSHLRRAGRRPPGREQRPEANLRAAAAFAVRTAPRLQRTVREPGGVFRPASASRICRSRAGATTPSSGPPSPASAAKPRSWRSGERATKALPAFPARAATCGTRSAMRRLALQRAARADGRRR